MLREVDQALAEDKTSEQIRKNLPAIVAAGLIIVVGVGGWQYWSAQKTAEASAESAAYSKALESGVEAEMHAAFEELGAKPGAYAVLAKMRLASDAATHGDREKALGLYREIYAARAGSKRLKDIARLRSGYLALADGREAVLKDVGDLETDTTAVGFHAREIIGLAALGAGDFQAAEQMFRKAASDAKAPQSLQLRANEFAALASAGKSGVTMPAVAENQKSNEEMYMETLEKAGADLSSIVDGEPAPVDAAPSDAGAQTPPPFEPVPAAQPEGNR